MPIAQKSYPMRFTPKGLVDALDATDKFPGACIQLANLVFDQSNPELVVSRPGVTSINTFVGFSSPGVVSVQITVGDTIYGMVASARNAGKDEVFAFDHNAGAFITISGITNGNSPTTQPTSGTWTAPTMAVIGTKIIVTHPGFPGGASKFGVLDISTPATPAWSATDTATNALPSVPTSVSNFNNRAYYACGQTLAYSDVLVPATRTNASQALTIGDTSNVLGLSGLPVQTTSGGITQALLAFKEFQVWQVTGDDVTKNLSLNFLSLTIGCKAPRSIVQSAYGTYFASNAGPYMVNPLGFVQAMTHSPQEIDPDIQAAWENCSEYTRIAACYAAGIYRICIPTVINGASVTNDYWYDEHRRRWTGPHTFTYDCASQHGNHFILVSNANPANLIHSQAIPSLSSVYTDLGVAFTGTLQSSDFPKTQDMDMKQVVESTIELASNASPASYGITGQDELQNTLNSCNVSVLPSGSLWGSGVWGGFFWASSINRPATYNVPWTAPLVFKKMSLLINITATTAVVIGTFMARFQNCGYTNVR